MNIIFNILNTLLSNIYSMTGDWGLSIVALTLLVKFTLAPFSLKQKISINNQQKLFKEQEELKKKFNKNKKAIEKMQIEYAHKNAKSMLGCLISFIQLPIIFTLYKVVISMPIYVGTMIVPWVANLKCSDSYFLIPLIYAAVQMFPNILPYIKQLNPINTTASKSGLIINSVISFIITVKAPIAIGIYFITSSLFAFLEEIFFRIYCKKYLSTF